MQSSAQTTKITNKYKMATNHEGDYGAHDESHILVTRGAAL